MTSKIKIILAADREFERRDKGRCRNIAEGVVGKIQHIDHDGDAAPRPDKGRHAAREHQISLALEMLAAKPELDTLLIPLSGGGLAAGMALAAKAIKPDLRIVGITMDRGAAMQASILAGQPVEVEEMPSLADSLGGGIGLENRHTFALCRDLIDEIVLVSEDEIYRAMQSFYRADRMVAEGASVVAIAALQSGRLAPSARMGTVVTGRNVDMEQFTRVVTGQDVTLGDVTVKGGHHA